MCPKSRKSNVNFPLNLKNYYFIPEKVTDFGFFFQDELLKTKSENFDNYIKKQALSKGFSNDAGGLEIVDACSQCMNLNLGSNFEMCTLHQG